ncbi:MAG: stage II sporulation protein R [Clostridia bacterium]|nr:stage II sporulation protein R [Clostridia bacterium]
MKTLSMIAAALTAAACALLFLFAGSAKGEYEAVRDDLRLHIIANSDSEEDQAAKLRVRDAVLACVRERFSAATRDEARTLLFEMGGELQSAAEEALLECGMDYGAQLAAGEFDFPDREYGERVYPAGRYEALRIVLGEGEGQNWWCVMFPPLCVIEDEPGSTEYNSDGTLAFKSFFVKLWKELFSK